MGTSLMPLVLGLTLLLAPERLRPTSVLDSTTFGDRAVVTTTLRAVARDRHQHGRAKHDRHWRDY